MGATTQAPETVSCLQAQPMAIFLSRYVLSWLTHSMYNLHCPAQARRRKYKFITHPRFCPSFPQTPSVSWIPTIES
uniref:Uncharacterized protein n=1 Tax=Rhizophora mucronata TaxID=61149 RepID=A0A2P2QD11_RHIMU